MLKTREEILAEQEQQGPEFRDDTRFQPTHRFVLHAVLWEGAALQAVKLVRPFYELGKRHVEVQTLDDRAAAPFGVGTTGHLTVCLRDAFTTAQQVRDRASGRADGEATPGLLAHPCGGRFRVVSNLPGGEHQKPAYWSVTFAECP